MNAARALPALAALVALALTIAAAPRAAHAQDADQFDRSWVYPCNDQQWAKIQRLVGTPAKELRVANWANSEPLRLANLRGKVVVLDFWGTWCPPCIRSIPKNNELHEKYADEIAFIGVCNNRKADRMNKVIREHDMAYPTAVDTSGTTERNYGVQWFPYYVVIDAKGIVTAAGVTPDNVERAIKAALARHQKPGDDAEAADKPDQQASVDDRLQTFAEGHQGRRNQLSGLRNATPPALELTNWTNTDQPINPADTEGKVVLVQFWATWCGPCKRSIPQINALHEKHADDGLVILAVCATRGAENMQKVVDEFDIRYPVAADVENTSTSRYQVNGFPDYYLIDRNGKIRLADCRNDRVEQAVELLLAEDDS